MADDTAPLRRGPKLLKALEDHAARVLELDVGLSESKARELGQLIAQQIANDFGGLRVYVPLGRWDDRGQKFSHSQLAGRNRSIHSEFNGRNRDELCRKYGISVARLYQIIARVRSDLSRASAPPQRSI